MDTLQYPDIVQMTCSSHGTRSWHTFEVPLPVTQILLAEQRLRFKTTEGEGGASDKTTTSAQLYQA